jgi:hypothetical protein
LRRRPLQGRQTRFFGSNLCLERLLQMRQRGQVRQRLLQRLDLRPELFDLVCQVVGHRMPRYA